MEDKREGSGGMCFLLIGAGTIARAAGFGVREIGRRVREESFPAVKEGREWKADPEAVKKWVSKRYGRPCQ